MLRETSSKSHSPGKVECSLRIDSKNKQLAELNLNKEIGESSYQSLQWIKSQSW